MIIRNYNDQSMTELNADDYWTLAHRLRKQVVACMDRGAYPKGEPEKLVTDTLNNLDHDGELRSTPKYA